jgi:hypothetical protein
LIEEWDLKKMIKTAPEVRFDIEVKELNHYFSLSPQFQ